MNNILLIGAGGIGSRHLQALAKSEIPLAICVIDVHKKALEIAEDQYRQMEDNGVPKSVQYSTNFDHIPPRVDIAIIATNSDVRKDVVQRVVDHTDVACMILEKILFQSLRDFDEIERLLNENKVMSWVNCPRRMIPFYQEIRDVFKGEVKTFIAVQGGEWGLASNAVHFLDLLSFFTGEIDIEIDASRVDNEIRESKRTGMKEFTGRLICRTKKGSELDLLSIPRAAAPVLITIMAGAQCFIIDEGSGKAALLKNAPSPRWEDKSFRFYFQSELTNLIVNDILQTGTCRLPSLRESVALHKPMMKAFIEHLEKATGRSWSYCPIT